MQINVCLCPNRTVIARWQVVACPCTTPMYCRCCSSVIVKANHLQPLLAGQLWRCCSSSPSTSKGRNEHLMFNFFSVHMQQGIATPTPKYLVSVLTLVKLTSHQQSFHFPARYLKIKQHPGLGGRVACMVCPLLWWSQTLGRCLLNEAWMPITAQFQLFGFTRIIGDGTETDFPCLVFLPSCRFMTCQLMPWVQPSTFSCRAQR